MLPNDSFLEARKRDTMILGPCIVILVEGEADAGILFFMQQLFQHLSTANGRARGNG
jgi:hypothetical protein